LCWSIIYVLYCTCTICTCMFSRDLQAGRGALKNIRLDTESLVMPWLLATVPQGRKCPLTMFFLVTTHAKRHSNAIGVYGGP
jgi:hypothetical protein